MRAFTSKTIPKVVSETTGCCVWTGKVVSIMFYTFIRTYGLSSGFVEIFRRCRRVQHQLRMQWMNMEMRKNCFATNETLRLLWARDIWTRVAGNSQGDPCLLEIFQTASEQSTSKCVSVFVNNRLPSVEHDRHQHHHSSSPNRGAIVAMRVLLYTQINQILFIQMYDELIDCHCFSSLKSIWRRKFVRNYSIVAVVVVVVEWMAYTTTSILTSNVFEFATITKSLSRTTATTLSLLWQQ